MTGQASTPLRMHDMLSRVFLGEGVKHIFALLGDANMCFVTRMVEAECAATFVRHEHCAVGAAMAYAWKTGNVGVCSVTCGPGLTQTMTALSTAVMARLPIVVFAGEAPLGKAWYNQRIEQAPFVEACGAAYHALHSPARMAEDCRNAFLQARRERRPVVIGVPLDLQDAPADGLEDLPTPSHELLPSVAPLQPHPEDLERAAAMLDQAGRVVIVAGLGAAGAGAQEACRALAARCDGLLGTSLPARGLFCEDPFSLGIVGGLSTEAARQELATADLVVAVGCSLAHHNTMGGKIAPRANVLQIDTDPVAMSQGNVAARHHLRGDARLSVEALAGRVAQRPARWRSTAVAERLAAPVWRGSDFMPEPGLHDPRAAVAALNDALPRDWELVNTSGHVSAFTAHMPGRPCERFLTIREFGAIGNGTSYAMGVAAARPERPVVLLEGDGSVMMHLQELETIARHEMKVLVVVFNDGAYSSESHKLRARGMALDGACFGRPDFAAIGRSFGLGGVTVTGLDDLRGLASDFAASGRGCVWDIPVTENAVSPTMQRLLTESMAR